MDHEYVPKAICDANVKHLGDGIAGMNSKLERHGLALYGADGRGGIVSDISTIKGDNKLIAKSLKTIEKSVNGGNKLKIAEKEISGKMLMALVGLLSSFVAAIAAVIVATLTGV